MLKTTKNLDLIYLYRQNIRLLNDINHKTYFIIVTITSATNCSLRVHPAADLINTNEAYHHLNAAKLDTKITGTPKSVHSPRSSHGEWTAGCRGEWTDLLGVPVIFVSNLAAFK